MIVYTATNTKTGQAYVGATSQQLKRRMQMHYRTAKKSPFVFHAALREDPAAFEWKVIAECDDKELRDLVEQEAIAKFKTHVSEGGYNMTRGGVGMFGDSMPPEAVKRAADARRGAKRTPEMRARMAAASTSRIIPIDAYDEIVRMRATGMSFAAIGRHYGCNEATIRQHLRRRK